MRKNLNVNKIVNEMDYLLYIIMKQEWEKNKDRLLKSVNKSGKTYVFIYSEINQSFSFVLLWNREGVVFFFENINYEGDKEKLIKKINNEIIYHNTPDHYSMIIEIELLKRICEVERV
jgi:hypothetical protein